MAVVTALTIGGFGSLGAQEVLPLAPLEPSGDLVAPFFDGWYMNPDGTYTLSFGFFNRNTEEIVEIDLGPNNRIEPAEYDGLQPTHFPPASYGGFDGRRERGVFAVRVPADFEGDVVWTITRNGKSQSVPGRITAVAYELSLSPMAAGSLAPAYRFDGGDAFVTGREGEWIERSVSVGAPLPLVLEVEDRGEREQRVPVRVTWFKHQGPGAVSFEGSPSTTEGPSGTVSATATFDTPGEYVLRGRVDNFRMSDSSFADQCCWSNAYVRVVVTE